MKNNFFVSLYVGMTALAFSVGAHACEVVVEQGAPVITKPMIEVAIPVCHSSYFVMFDPTNKTPVYAAEHLLGTLLNGPEVREGDFAVDPAIPHDKSAKNSDYLGSGYAKGHMAPASDARYNQEAMRETFTFANAVPQNPGMNSGLWRKIESQVLHWAIEYDELYVVTGPLNPSPDKRQTIGGSGVTVPLALFKVVANPATGESIGFVVPNTSVKSNSTLDKYVLPVSQIEKMAGVVFFPNQSNINKSTVNLWK